jgi:hypothetical protein
MTIRCPKCDTCKPTSGFYRNRASYTGFNTYCKPCQNAANDRSKAKNPSLQKEYDRKSWLKRRFGAEGIGTYDRLMEEQGGLCAICRQDCKSGMRLAVDHNHGSGRIRGLLCRDCNTSLGKFGDSVDRLRAAVAYLERYAE